MNDALKAGIEAEVNQLLKQRLAQLRTALNTALDDALAGAKPVSGARPASQPRADRKPRKRAPTRASDEVIQQVCDHLGKLLDSGDHEPQGTEAVRLAIGVGARTVADALHRLAAEGTIEDCGRNKYRWRVESGERQANGQVADADFAEVDDPNQA